jgi:hypothetical protein
MQLKQTKAKQKHTAFMHHVDGGAQRIALALGAVQVIERGREVRIIQQQHLLPKISFGGFS